MKTSLIIFFCIVFFSLSAQIPNPIFKDFTITPCPFDDSKTIVKPTSWLFYQTQNNEWDGPIDSSICISLMDIGNRLILPLDQIDDQRSLFIRSEIFTGQLPNLFPDQLYDAESYFRINGAVLNEGEDCDNGFCSGFQIEIAIPNEDDTGTINRVYQSQYEVFNSNVFTETCLPTEFFSSNQLAEVIIKLTFSEVSTADANLEFLRLSLSSPTVLFQFLDDTLYANNTFNNRHQYLIDYSYPNHFVLKYDSTDGYPKPTNLSYTEVFPPTNTSQQDTIDIIIGQYINFIPQPFTQFRGGQVNGIDSLRHIIQLTNNGGSVCLPPFIDLVFGDQNCMIYRSGQIKFGGIRSCIQFLNGGKLIIADNSHLELGSGGNGIIALRQGGSIEVGKNSSLTIDNQMVLYEYRASQPHQIYMSLNEGSTLRFGPHSRLSNHLSLNKQMKLNIFMNGGVLDDHHLNQEERQLIRKIYPKSEKRLSDNIGIYPNPGNGNPMIRFHSDENKYLQICIYQQDGRIIRSTSLEVEKGIGHYTTDWHLPQGVFIIKFTDMEDVTTERLVVIE